MGKDIKTGINTYFTKTNSDYIWYPKSLRDKSMKTKIMKFNESNNQPKGLNVIQKIGICVLILTIILYYVLSIQFLTA